VFDPRTADFCLAVAAAHDDSTQVVCAEALLPLAITAVVTTEGSHNSQHAKWGELSSSWVGLRREKEGRARERRPAWKRTEGGHREAWRGLGQTRLAVVDCCSCCARCESGVVGEINNIVGGVDLCPAYTLRPWRPQKCCYNRTIQR